MLSHLKLRGVFELRWPLPGFSDKSVKVQLFSLSQHFFFSLFALFLPCASPKHVSHGPAGQCSTEYIEKPSTQFLGINRELFQLKGDFFPGFVATELIKILFKSTAPE